MMRSFKIYTLGCKANQYDAQSIRERFLQRGFTEASNGLKPNFYIVNTCTVTKNADLRSITAIRYFNKINPEAKIIVTGCLVEKDALILAKIKGISLIVRKRFFPEGISGFNGHARAFLKIQDGCNNFCSYCKVRLVRGKSRSRQLGIVIDEARRLVKRGFKELVLSGICLGFYGKDLSPAINLVDLIAAMENIEGLLRIRLSSIEAGDISDDLIGIIASSKKICRHLHIPIQSGDDEILKKMNRRYNRSFYLNLIKNIRKNIPNVAITTDVIIGFYGETENNFQNTIDLIKEISPLKVHIFPYSKRENTPATFNYTDEVAPSVIRERARYLRDVAENCADNFKKRFLNEKMDVLVEVPYTKNPEFWLGFTDNYIKVLVKSRENLRNQLIKVKLEKIAKDYVLSTAP